MRYCILILALLMAGPAFAGPDHNSQQFVRILPAVEVDEPLINLWHLADQQKPMGGELINSLSRATVGAAPELGESFEISGVELRRLINDAGLSPDISILLPDKVRVTRAAIILSREDLLDIYEETLQREINGQDLELVIMDVDTGQEINLPSGQFTYQAKRLGSRWGRVAIMVDFYINGRRQAQTRITGTAEIYGQALVAARSLPAGHVVSYQDITSARLNMSEAGKSTVNDPALVVGLKLRSPLNMGSALDPRRMQQEILVRSGDIVNMVCVNPHISLSTKGRVEQSGYANSVIKLTNLSSRRPVYGRVVDAGTVVVDF